MPDETYDEIEFTMVGGQTFRKRAPVVLGDTYEGTWLEIDEVTRVRTDKIVSIKLHAHDNNAPRIL